MAPQRAGPTASGTALRDASDPGSPQCGLVWDITYLPTTVRGVWLYLYLVVDVWSRLPGRRPTCRRHLLVALDVALDVAEVESAEIAARHSHHGTSEI